MKNIFVAIFLTYCKLILCQIQNIEENLYDLFVFDSNKFLTGKEDLRYHPARLNTSQNYLINTNMRYHDIYREWTVNKNKTKNYQYDFEIMSRIPITLFTKKLNLYADFGSQTFSSFYRSENNGTEFNVKTLKTYSINGGLLYDDTTYKIGLRIKYSHGVSDPEFQVNLFPEDKEDALLNKYFYNLLEPSFGKNIYFNIKENEINYAFEYYTTLYPYLNIGFNLYREINDHDIKINYYSSVEKIEGKKHLNGLIKSDRYSAGFSSEFIFNKLKLRFLTNYSIPKYGLSIDQDDIVRKNDVDLEISNLTDSYCDGKGTNFGVGATFALNNKISINISYTRSFNDYSGKLNSSTPVLGFEIIPIAHQLNIAFDDYMKNYQLVFEFYHIINNMWNYSFNFEYLNSTNNIKYDYKILTLFGIGNSKEQETDLISAELFKIDLKTIFKITDYLAVKLEFEQYVPIITNNDKKENITGNNEPANEQNNLYKKKWGGSIYNISLMFNFN